MNIKQWMVAQAFDHVAVDNASFVDIGALYMIHGETITTAANYTSDLTIIDIWEPLWPPLKTHLEKNGVHTCEYICQDILSYSGRPFDVVFCGGVIYHMPDPGALWHQLARIGKGELVIQSLICDSLVDDGRRSLLGASDEVVDAARAFFQLKLGNLPFIFPPHEFQYAPIYWLYSRDGLRREAELNGWHVRLEMVYEDVICGLHLRCET